MPRSMKSLRHSDQTPNAICSRSAAPLWAIKLAEPSNTWASEGFHRIRRLQRCR